MIHFRYLALSLVLAASGAPAQPDWSRAPRVDVTLSSFRFTPNRLHLHAGAPVVLHLVNASGSGHDFTARDFFAVASVRPEDRAAVQEGSVEMHGHGSRDIALVPAAGRYKLKCTHTFHGLMGMSGEIVVD